MIITSVELRSCGQSETDISFLPSNILSNIVDLQGHLHDIKACNELLDQSVTKQTPISWM